MYPDHRHIITNLLYAYDPDKKGNVKKGGMESKFNKKQFITEWCQTNFLR